MPEQYFTASPTSQSRPHEFTEEIAGFSLTFTTDAGVFSRGEIDAGTRLLIENLPTMQAGERALDIGCGWGPVGTVWALMSPQAEITLTDINERAVKLAQGNCARNNAHNTMCVQGDSLENVSGLFDAAAFNPPIRTGKENIYRMFRDIMGRLKPGGEMYIVIRVKQGAGSAKKMLIGEFGNCDTIDRGGGYHILKCVKQEDVQ